jgi:hypothetical protein
MNRFYGTKLLRLYVTKPHILGKNAYWSYGVVIIVWNGYYKMTRPKLEQMQWL